MSLLVWLPLNDNFTNNGTTYFEDFELPSNASWSAGKLGNNLNISNASTRRTITKLNNLKEFSISLWYKMKPDTTYTQWKDVIMVTDSISEFRLETVNTAGTATSWYGYGMNASGTGHIAVTTGIWYHDTVVVSGRTIKRYINGNLQSTTTSENDCQLAGDLRLGDTGMYCQIADVRIYDHCLSKKEVKEISKGLVCHYPLNQLTSINNTVRNATYAVYNNFTNVGATGSITSTGKTYDGCTIYKLTFTPTADCLSHVQTTLHGHGIYGFRTTFLANTKYCFWILYRPVSHPDTVCGGTASNIGGFTEIPPTKWSDDWMIVGQYRNGSVTSDKTDNIHVSFKTPSATTGTPITIEFCCPHLVTDTQDILPEYDYQGDSPTIEYDTSGYCNHGTRTGSLTITSDTPRHGTCTKFSNDTYIRINSMPTVSGYANSYTFSWWGNYNSTASKMMWGYWNGNRLNLYLNNGKFFWNTADGNNNPFGSISSDEYLNKWHHFVITGNGTTTKLYIDGVFKANATTYKAITGTDLIMNGWNTANDYDFNGTLSDFRLYATALSESDIKELYNQPISFNKHSTMIQGEFIEK